MFFVIEGIDGAGKSTVCSLVAQKLRAQGLDVCELREPTSGVYGREIRKLIASPEMPAAETLLDLFLRDRQEDAETNIQPALSKGLVIVMDRYYYSNAAYQAQEGFSAADIMRMNEERGFPVPDRVFFLDLHPAEALRRLSARSGSEVDCFEREDRLTNIRGNYLAILDERCTIMDATATAESLAEKIAAEIFSMKRSA